MANVKNARWQLLSTEIKRGKNAVGQLSQVLFEWCSRKRVFDDDHVATHEDIDAIKEKEVAEREAAAEDVDEEDD
ncbi:hypothetical protein LXL04_039533 [Taraxacum kok-saghyz]